MIDNNSHSKLSNEKDDANSRDRKAALQATKFLNFSNHESGFVGPTAVFVMRMLSSSRGNWILHDGHLDQAHV